MYANVIIARIHLEIGRHSEDDVPNEGNHDGQENANELTPDEQPETSVQTTRGQPNNPLHGVKLVDILEYLVEEFGWQELADQIDIRCFKSDPSIKSSLKFLRQTQWARDKVERLYLHSIRQRRIR